MIKLIFYYEPGLGPPLLPQANGIHPLLRMVVAISDGLIPLTRLTISYWSNFWSVRPRLIALFTLPLCVEGSLIVKSLVLT